MGSIALSSHARVSRKKAPSMDASRTACALRGQRAVIYFFNSCDRSLLYVETGNTLELQSLQTTQTEVTLRLHMAQSRYYL